MCTCKTNTCTCNCDTCESCPIQLDFSCIFYNKSGLNASNLDTLGLPNGSTLKLVVEAIDNKLTQIDVDDWSIPFLEEDFSVTNLKQFGEAVDDVFAALREDVDTALEQVGQGLTATDSTTINFTTSGTLNHTLTGAVIVSPQSDNRLSILSDGLYSAPQNLSVNATAKTISISGGNSISVAGLFTTVGGFLGNVASDPSTAINGQYWYNTAQEKLKIKVNNTTKEIPLV